MIINNSMPASIMVDQPNNPPSSTENIHNDAPSNLLETSDIATTHYEPLKVCLDDDSSIEDDDEDMFDDDAFYFGDEDFRELLSRVPAKAPARISLTATTSSLVPQSGGTAACNGGNSFLPVMTVMGEHHHRDVHCIDSASSSTTGLTSSGPSSSGEILAMILCLLLLLFL